MKFIELNAVDPFTEGEDAFNPVYIAENNVVHIEGFSGPFQLQAYGPDGRVTVTGRSKQIIGGSLLILGVGGYRIVRESPKAVLEVLKSSF